MDKCCKTAAVYVASLKAIYLIHQQSHWLAKGENFYGNHQLFQRLYESAQSNLDSAAEEFIGLFGDECLDFKFQNELVYKIQNKMINSKNKSLDIEKSFISFSEIAYDCFESENKLSQGLDDIILSIASEREKAIYLLSRIM